MKKQTKSFTDEQLRKALFGFQDLMERFNCPFYPLRHTAKQVREESELQGELYFGVKKNEWTEGVQRTFKAVMELQRIDYKREGNKYEFELNGVPIHFQIIQRNYKFFRNPEVRFFGVGEFLIPNPLDNYLKAQYLIK
jgi:hypothetical protein